MACGCLATFARGPALELAFHTLISQQVSKQAGHAVDALDATGLRQLSQWYGCFAAIQQGESARYPLRLSRISSCEAESRRV